MIPAKQARGDSGNEPKLYQVTEWIKKRWGVVLLWAMNEQGVIIINHAGMEPMLGIGSVRRTCLPLVVSAEDLSW